MAFIDLPIFSDLEVTDATSAQFSDKATVGLAGQVGPAEILTAVTADTLHLWADMGAGELPALVSFASQNPTAEGVNYLPSLYSVGDSWYVPPAMTEGFGVLNGLTSVGILGSTSIGAIYLNCLVSQGWLRSSTDDAYTDANMVGAWNIPSLFGISSEGQRLEVTFLERVFAVTGYGAFNDLVVIFSSDLTVSDVYAVTRQAIVSLLDALTASSLFTPLGNYQVSQLDALGLNSIFTSSIDQAPGPFTSDTTVWVFNVDNNGSTQYDNYGFNSFAKRDATYLGAADDGLYLLEGDDDQGRNITAEISLALSRFATPQAKYFPALYLGVTSTGRMLLKANVDGTDWLFEANNTSSTMANQRIDLGKGLRGSHWRFTILNQDGLDFDLESVEFMPLVSSRRVY